jgi:hypothetical protein
MSIILGEKEGEEEDEEMRKKHETTASTLYLGTAERRETEGRDKKGKKQKTQDLPAVGHQQLNNPEANNPPHPSSSTDPVVRYNYKCKLTNGILFKKTNK